MGLLGFVWVSFSEIFAHPLRGLNEIFYSTSLRPGKLDGANSAFGLRHARSPYGTLPWPCYLLQKFHRAAPGTRGVWLKNVSRTPHAKI